MSRVEKPIKHLPCPAGTDDEYTVRLTNKEMQCVINAVAGFYNVANRERWKVSAEQTLHIGRALEKMNKASRAGIVVVK